MSVITGAFKHTDNGTEFSNKTLMARINELWKGTKIVHGRPRHPQDQGSVERANGDFKNMLYCWCVWEEPTNNLPEPTNNNPPRTHK